MNTKKFLILAAALIVGLGTFFLVSSGDFFKGQIKVAYALSVSLDASVTDQTVKEGSQNVKIASWNISAKSDTVLKEMLFTFKGADAKVINSVSLKMDTLELGKGYVQNSKVSFKDLNYTIEEGETKQVSLWVDISDEVEMETKFKFTLRTLASTDLSNGKSTSKGFGSVGPTVTLIDTDGKLVFQLDPNASTTVKNYPAEKLLMFSGKSYTDQFQIKKVDFCIQKSNNKIVVKNPGLQSSVGSISLPGSFNDLKFCKTLDFAKTIFPNSMEEFFVKANLDQLQTGDSLVTTINSIEVVSMTTGKSANVEGLPLVHTVTKN